MNRIEGLESGGRCKFICVEDLVDEPMLLERAGLFDVRGTFEGKLPFIRPARYTGQVEGNRMILTVTVAETGSVDTFTLTFGTTFPGRTCR